VTLLFRFFSTLAAVVPRGVADAAAVSLGLAWYHLLPIRRRVAFENLRLAYDGRFDDRRVREVCRGNFIHLMRNLVEFLRMAGGGMRPLRPLLEVRGWERIERARAAGRGVIILSGHVGNFDLLVCSLVDRGLPLHILTKHARAGAVDRFWQGSRARLGADLLPRRQAARSILSSLRRNEAIGIVIDQHQRGNASIVDFFGRPAATTEAAAVFADRTGAPVIPVFMRRLAGGRHRMEVEEDLGFERISGDRAANVRHNVQRYTAAVERAVRRAPDQWLWVHRRWKVGIPRAELPD
jgi:KDO2-lipid IV(A) lauroyltransferase